MGAESAGRKELPIDALRNKLREVAFADSWEEALSFLKKISTTSSTKSLFTFSQLQVMDKNLPEIEAIMKQISALGSTVLDDDRKNVLRMKKAELIGGLPKDYDFREIVARVTEVAGEDIDRVYEVQDKRRLKEYEERGEIKE